MSFLLVSKSISKAQKQQTVIMHRINYMAALLCDDRFVIFVNYMVEIASNPKCNISPSTEDFVLCFHER